MSQNTHASARTKRKRERKNSDTRGRRDFVDREYLWTGDISEDLYSLLRINVGKQVTDPSPCLHFTQFDFVILTP